MVNKTNNIAIIYPKYPYIPTNPNSDKGAVSSLVGSALQGGGLKGTALMYASGALGGGIAAEVTGGSFLEGAATGLIVTALNHALHEVVDPDPTQQQKQKSEQVLQYEKENGVTLFSSTDEAAIDWGMNVNATSIQKNVEYSSNIYEVKIDGNSWYGYTEPSTLNSPVESNGPSKIPIPIGTKLAGHIHSHGAKFGKLYNEYSPEYKTIARDYKPKPFYLSSPDGVLYKFKYHHSYYKYTKYGGFENPKPIYKKLPFDKN